jgi:hypothetical protein
MLSAGVLLAAVLHAHGVVPPSLLRSVLSVAHSHNDYEQRRPLAQALEAGFPSVEADVWQRGREIVVSHHGFFELSDRGRLEDLYLKPLQERVDRLGSVLGDGQVFYLWIDLKDSSRGLTDGLHDLLARYPMFGVFADDWTRPGAVVAILTGDEDAKRRYTDEHPVRYACRDSNALGENDPAADQRWTWYALAWDDLVEESTATEHGFRSARLRLRRAVERAHALGRRLRIYGIPERPAAWEAAITSGADLVGTDRIEAFGAYLRARHGPFVADAFATVGVTVAPAHP